MDLDLTIVPTIDGTMVRTKYIVSIVININKIFMSEIKNREVHVFDLEVMEVLSKIKKIVPEVTFNKHGKIIGPVVNRNLISSEKWAQMQILIVELVGLVDGGAVIPQEYLAKGEQ